MATIFIPTDVLYLIVAKVPINDLRNLFAANKRFSQLNNNHLWQLRGCISKLHMKYYLSTYRSDRNPVLHEHMQRNYQQLQCIGWSDLEPILLTPHLVTLSLSGGTIDIKAIATLSSLTILQLNVGNITNLDCIGSLTNLVALHIDSPCDVLPIRNLTKLVRLIVCKYHSDGRSLPLLPLLTVLRILHISDGLKAVPNCNTNISTLNLCNNNLGSVDKLSHYLRLSNLTLSNTQTSDIAPLSRLTELYDLDIARNPITDISPLRCMLLYSLNMAQTRVVDISTIGMFTRLSTLIISHNQISDISPLCNLAYLYHFQASHCNISDISVAAHFTNLCHLHIENNSIVDITPLCNLRGLHSLQLQNNLIEDITGLTNLHGLRYVDLNNNKITDADALRRIKCNSDISGQINTQFC